MAAAPELGLSCQGLSSELSTWNDFCDVCGIWAIMLGGITLFFPLHGILSKDAENYPDTYLPIKRAYQFELLQVRVGSV